MRENDLKAHQKRRFKKTTDSKHKGRIAPNLLARRATFPRARTLQISATPTAA
jgi:hypothetical protein